MNIYSVKLFDWEIYLQARNEDDAIDEALVVFTERLKKNKCITATCVCADDLRK